MDALDALLRNWPAASTHTPTPEVES
jgi:hypothetical protein